MKHLSLLILIATSMLVTACAVSQPKIGEQGQSIGAQQLLNEFDAFAISHQNYKTAQDDVEQLRKIAQPLTIIGLFGTWCHDSEREVPRLVKLVEQANNPLIELKLIAVNIKKQAPEHYQLKYTPTFVVLDEEQQEIGRIVERPKVSLGKDIADFVMK